MPANLENSVLGLLLSGDLTTQQWPQDWIRSVFVPIPKKENAKEYSNYCTIAGEPGGLPSVGLHRVGHD